MISRHDPLPKKLQLRCALVLDVQIRASNSVVLALGAIDTLPNLGVQLVGDKSTCPRDFELEDALVLHCGQRRLRTENGRLLATDPLM